MKKIPILLCAIMLLTGCTKDAPVSQEPESSSASEVSQESGTDADTEASTDEKTTADVSEKTTSVSEKTADTTEKAADEKTKATVSVQMTGNINESASFEDVREKLGLSDAELEKMARRSLVRCFDCGQMNVETDSDISEYYSKTIKKRNDCIKADISSFTYTIDGDEVYLNCTSDLVPENKIKLEEASGNKASAELDYISARLDNDRVYISFRESDEWRNIFYGSQYTTPGQEDFSYGKEYELTGLYGRYSDIFICRASGSELPQLYLVSEDGYLEYVDIFNCMNYGRLCPMPVPGDFGCCKILPPGTEGNDDELAAYALNEMTGEKYDLSRWLNGMHYAIPEGFFSIVVDEHDLGNGGFYCDIANITIDEYGSYDSNTTALDAVISEGWGIFKLLGMDDEGILLGYSYFEKDNVGPEFGVVSSEYFS